MENKDKPVSVRFDSKDYKMVAKAAIKHRMKVSTWIRECAVAASKEEGKK